MKSPQAQPVQGIKRLVLAIGLGGILEYYDAFIASLAAASVWPVVFFSGVSPSLAFAASIASFGAFYITRPVGAYLFGHYGDRLGRRVSMVATILAMGVGLVGVGLTPGYASVGVSAIVILIAFRLLFGIGLGGEFGGGVAWITEFAPKSKRRGFLNVWVTPAPIALALAALSFAILQQAMGPAFLTVGWRIPFVLGGILVAFALFARYRLQESPMLKALRDSKSVDSAPASSALREKWKTVLVLALAWTFGGVPSILQVPYSINYLVAKGFSSNLAPVTILLAAVVGIPLLVFGGMLSDRTGRRPALTVAILLCAASSAVFFFLVNTLNVALVVVAQSLVFGSVMIGAAVVPAWFAEQFPTKYRQSAAGMSYQFGALFSGILTVVVLPALIVLSPSAVAAAGGIAALAVAICAVSLVAVRSSRETKGDEIV